MSLENGLSDQIPLPVIYSIHLLLVTVFAIVSMRCARRAKQMGTVVAILTISFCISCLTHLGLAFCLAQFTNAWQEGGLPHNDLITSMWWGFVGTFVVYVIMLRQRHGTAHSRT